FAPTLGCPWKRRYRLWSERPSKNASSPSASSLPGGRNRIVEPSRRTTSAYVTADCIPAESRTNSRVEESPRPAGSHGRFPGGDHVDRHLGPDTQVAEVLRDRSANVGPVLADPCREDERVQTPERGRHRGDCLRHAVGEHAEAERVVEASERGETGV